MKPFEFLVLIGSLGIVSCGSRPSPLEGRWQTECAALEHGGSVHIALAVDGDRATRTVESFADKACTERTGTYLHAYAIDAIAGNDAELRVKRTVIALHRPEEVARMNEVNYCEGGWQVTMAREVTDRCGYDGAGKLVKLAFQIGQSPAPRLLLSMSDGYLYQNLLFTRQ